MNTKNFKLPSKRLKQPWVKRSDYGRKEATKSSNSIPKEKLDKKI